MNSHPPLTAVNRLVVVDDHPFMRRGLIHSINSQPGLKACGEAESAENALQVVQQVRPDVVITDIALPGKNGLELVKDLQAFDPTLPVVVLSMHDESIYAERALRAGAKAYVMKQEGPDTLFVAIDKVLAGEVYVSEKVSGCILLRLGGSKDSNAPIRILTDREFEVFRLIGEGKNAKQTALKLHVSPKTIDSHRANIRGKLNLSNSHALALYAVRWIESEK